MKPRDFVVWHGLFYVPLTQGQVTLVDPEDAPWLTLWNWFCHKDKCGNWRVQRQIRHGQKREYVCMARLIMQTPDNMTVDHIHGDTLDHRKSNLRNCTLQQNLQNQRVAKGRTYKGVQFQGQVNKKNPWMARIRAFGKSLYLGSFPTEKDAAGAYNEAALEYFGDFARLNVIDDD